MDRDEEKDLYIKSKIKDGHIPEKIDNLFNNSTKIVKENGGDYMEENNHQPKKNKKGIIVKRIAAVAACGVIALGGGNIYASTQGYDNVFFMIKEWIAPSQDAYGKDDILEDRDITISYKYIEIAKGLKLSINKLNIKDNKAKLYLTLDEENPDLEMRPFTYIVRDEDGNEMCKHKGGEYRYVYTPEELTLENFKKDTKNLELEILKKDNTTLVKIKIKLQDREIEVVGNEQEIKKISEEELKDHLSKFALLNYIDENLKNIESKEALQNERKLMIVRELAVFNTEKNIYAGLTYDLEHDILKTEEVHKYIQSFTNLELEEDGLMELGNVYAKKQKEEGVLSYIDMPSYGFRTGLCLDVKDIMYSQGVYTVTFTYCYPEHTPSHQGYLEGVEDLPIYEMTIGLTINEDDTYSKYFVSTWTEPQLVKEGKNDDIQEEEEDVDNALEKSMMKFVGTWYLDYAIKNEKYEEPLGNLFGSTNIRIEIKKDGTYTEFVGDTEYNTGTIGKIDDERIKLINVLGEEELIYCENKLGEIVIAREHQGTDNIYEYFIKARNELKSEFIGVWERTFNVDHEESGEYMLEINGDGTFLEQELSKITNRGTYKITQEYGWDKITLIYDNGEEREILYTKTEEPKLHYSLGRQVFSKSTTISSFENFE